MNSYQLFAFATLKGGVRKTTSAMFSAFELGRRGKKVTVFDADTRTQGVTDWCTRYYNENPDGELPFNVYQWSHQAGLLMPFVNNTMRETKDEFAIIDIGGEAPEVLAQVARRSNRVISPVGPEDAELGRLHATRAQLRESGNPPMHVLLTRVPKIGSGIAAAARQMLTEQPDPYDVLGVEIPQEREVYAHNAWGKIPPHNGKYVGLVDFLLENAS